MATPRTVRDLIYRALRLAGCYGSSESIDAADASDALLALNQMVDMWSADSLLVFQNQEDTFPLIAGVASYSIGPGATFNTQRPVAIQYAFVRDANGIDRPVQVLEQATFAGITLKGIANTYPTSLWNDEGNPSSVLTFYPAPIAGLILHIGLQQALASFANLSDAVNLPPAYEEALVCSLADIIAPEYQRQCPVNVVARARAALARIRSVNLPRDASMAIEFAGPGGSDAKAQFYSGY